MNKLFSLFVALFVTTALWAYDFEVGGIYYNILDANRVEVTRKKGSSESYSGKVSIPEIVTLNGKTYSVTNIDCFAFSNCSSLTSITIPESMTFIEPEAFRGCSSLSSIVWNAANHQQFSGYISTPFYSILSQITSFTFGDNVETIPAWLCAGMINLKSIIIPKKVTNVGMQAFSGCSSLTSIMLPNSVIRLEQSVFSGCSSLVSFTIPNSITSIGEAAFMNCSSLTSITIPENVTSIGDNAFRECTSLTSITLPNSITSIGSHAFLNAPMTSATLTAPTMEAFCQGTTNQLLISSYFFKPDRKVQINGKEVTKIVIPETINAVKSKAFNRCLISSVEIGNSVTSVGDSAFYNCSSLNSVTLGSNITNIGKYAFYGCSTLNSITIPKNITSIGIRAFQECSSLTSVFWNATNYEEITKQSDTPFYYILSQITSFTFGDNVESIPAYLCYSMKNLKSVIIPDNVISIGERAFDYCYKLEEVYCYPTTPPTVTSERTFENYKATLYVPCDSKEIYEEHPVFGKFEEIEGLDDCGGGFVTTHIHDTICEGEVYEFGEYLCDTTGTYTAIIGGVTTFLYLTVLPSSMDTITVEAYDSYEWHGNIYTESGIYTYEEDCYQEILYLTIISSSETALDDVQTDSDNSAQKIFRDQQLLILRDGKTYNAMGQEM